MTKEEKRKLWVAILDHANAVADVATAAANAAHANADVSYITTNATYAYAVDAATAAHNKIKQLLNVE